MTLDPLLQKQIRRFKKNRRAFYSLIILSALFITSLFSELICNNLPIIVHYEHRTYFPLLKFHSGAEFDEPDSAIPDYKVMRQSEKFKKDGNWMLFPPIIYGPNESMNFLADPPPTPPSRTNFLGTDDRGRDLLTRLIYGFRNSLLFALISWVLTVIFSYTVGALQGYLGGRVDFIGQRLTEIWAALPILYVIIFLLSIFPPSLVLLTAAWVAFVWINLAAYIRVEVLRARKLDFVAAAQALGAGLPRVILRHILPNTLTPIITFSPFIISASIGSLAALDYLGLGLPPPTASWGELVRQGKENLSSWWLSTFPFLSIFFTLLLLNFIGEGVRSAFDSREA